MRSILPEQARTDFASLAGIPEVILDLGACGGNEGQITSRVNTSGVSNLQAVTHGRAAEKRSS